MKKRNYKPTSQNFSWHTDYTLFYKHQVNLVPKLQIWFRVKFVEKGLEILVKNLFSYPFFFVFVFLKNLFQFYNLLLKKFNTGTNRIATCEN